MSLKKMTKEDLELLSNKDITDLILSESKKSINTADLFKKIIELLELPSSTFENKIGDYYTSLATDKRFILLEDGTWDLKSNHTVKVAIDEIYDDNNQDECEEEQSDEIMTSDIEEPDDLDAIDDTNSFIDDDADDELADLTIVNDDELEE